MQRQQRESLWGSHILARFWDPAILMLLGSIKHPSTLMILWYRVFLSEKIGVPKEVQKQKIGLTHVPIQRTEVTPLFNWILQSPLLGCWNCSALILLDSGLDYSLVLLFSFLHAVFFPRLDLSRLLSFCSPFALTLTTTVLGHCFPFGGPPASSPWPWQEPWLRDVITLSTWYSDWKSMGC